MHDDEPLSLSRRRLPEAFDSLAVIVEAGGARPFDPAEWRDALVVVERGAVDLECTRGGRRRFERGAVMWLDGLPLRALHNPGPEPAVLVAVWRRAPPTSARGSAGPPSRSRPDH